MARSVAFEVVAPIESFVVEAERRIEVAACGQLST